jgi:hypothetical protein
MTLKDKPMPMMKQKTLTVLAAATLLATAGHAKPVKTPAFQHPAAASTEAAADMNTADGCGTAPAYQATNTARPPFRRAMRRASPLVAGKRQQQETAQTSR